MRMHPQSELENYKLQVELLQEKLHRSEDNRQELEKKLEQIMKKRNEHERTLRSRSQLKYQQFLDEQKKRNERNRKLVEMLERIDQQAAALSARSERLKMMKLQYELYFSRLVQSYSMKTLQNIPAVSLRTIQRSSNLNATLRPDDKNVAPEAFQTSSTSLSSSFNNTSQFQRVPIPVVVPISNEQNRCQPSWTFASAPPGVLIALPNNATLPMSTSSSLSDNVENKKIQSNFCFDYSQFPIGYLQAAATTSTVPMQYNVGQTSYLQHPFQHQHQQKPSAERHTEPLFAADDDIKQSRPHFEFRVGVETPSSLSSSIPFADVKTNETISNRTQSNQLIPEQPVCGNKPKKYDDLEFNEDKENGQESQNFKQTRGPMFNKDFQVSHQSLKVDKLPNIKLNNSFQQQQEQEQRRFVHEGNIPNTIDFRTDNDNDDNKYIKYIKEMEETYDEKNVPVPISLTPQELSIDNITTTLQLQKIQQKTQKIDKTNVGDDEKINDMDDNEKNTSSSSASSAPLDGKCSIESIGDEALTFTKKPFEYKTQSQSQPQEHISNTAPARNIDPSRDTEQITLFNGTKNSKDESTRASNRTTAIIDGDVGENKENTENTRMDPNSNVNPNSNTNTSNNNNYRPLHFDKKEKMSIENIETAIYGELLTKPDNLTSSDTAAVAVSQPLPLVTDNPRGNGGDDKEIEQNSQKTKGYEFTNLEKDSSYEQDPVMGDELEHQQVAPYATEIEQIEAKHDALVENNQEAYPYTDNVGSIEEQQYDYSYSDPNAATIQEGASQQEYSYTEDGQVAQGDENYAQDYQNYDASQYPADYDPNAYQYDYNQGQYDENNQQQYAPEGYSQEYQQDPYAGEYANYEQVASNEGETSNQTYAEGDYAPVEQEAGGNQIKENYSAEQEAFNTDKADTQNFENVAETSYEEKIEPEPDRNLEPEQKVTQPASILSTEKNSDLASKKKKRVNFVDSETDESSTTAQKQPGVSSESDFDFSTN
ncbi:myb-like protein P [Episyrphus balteatus]|uniref:myb-like protein P n=1 Tax=Episyrphus balteatus TaxID=286459 RepID=UPI002485AFB3|nr:myb-like protein P [Episyrphus balteatus]